MLVREGQVQFHRFSAPFTYACPLCQALPLLGQIHFFCSTEETTVFLFNCLVIKPMGPSHQVHGRVRKQQGTLFDLSFFIPDKGGGSPQSHGVTSQPHSYLGQHSSVGAHTASILHPHGDLRAVGRDASAQILPKTFSNIANRSSPGEKHNLLFPLRHSRRWEKWCKYSILAEQ